MHEIMHKFKSLKTETVWVTIKLYMKEACDGIEGDFILKCLNEIGFYPNLILWIREYIYSISYSLIANDEPNGFIKPMRGIR